MNRLILFASVLFLASLMPFIARADPSTEAGVNATTAAVDSLVPVLEQIETNTAQADVSISLLAITPQCIDINLAVSNIEFAGNFFRILPIEKWFRRDRVFQVFVSAGTIVKILTSTETQTPQTHIVGVYATPVEAEICHDALAAVI